DEAHRFGITHHRDRRSKSQIVSELDSIKGIGEVTKTALLKHFKSVKKIREASLDAVAEVIGPAKARLVVDALRSAQ
ncbi:MAG: excinuclease ABC subunit C, partial [Muribaculaceae bacterium]|nr:excinuclease ABC subunit C [Muribaculaceae bacterium]